MVHNFKLAFFPIVTVDSAYTFDILQYCRKQLMQKIAHLTKVFTKLSIKKIKKAILILP